MNCIRCNHEWIPRVDKPIQCPLCNTICESEPLGIGISPPKGSDMYKRMACPVCGILHRPKCGKPL